jgi:hypothetical protein
MVKHRYCIIRRLSERVLKRTLVFSKSTSIFNLFFLSKVSDHFNKLNPCETTISLLFTSNISFAFDSVPPPPAPVAKARHPYYYLMIALN